MKIQILVSALLISICGAAQTPSNFEVKLLPHQTMVKTTDKGKLVFDSKSCSFKMLRENLFISVVEKNYFIEFPNGSTVIAVVDELMKGPLEACFHTLTIPTNKKLLKVSANKTNLGSLQDPVTKKYTEEFSDGLVNCKSRNGHPVSDEIRYSFNNATSPNYKVHVNKQSGLTFFKDNKPVGSNIRRNDLNFDETYRSKCETPAPNSMPGTKTPGQTS